MQDEVNTKVVAIAIKGGRITAEVLKKALAKFIEEIEKAEKQASQPKTYRGKQSIKHLVEQNAAISNIEVTDGNIKSFERTANKYGIDYALKKDTSEQPPRYLVFFKGRDVDVMTQAFKAQLPGFLWERENHLETAEKSTEQNYNMIDEQINNEPPDKGNITVLAVEPLQEPYIKEIPNTLEAMRKEVGGPIQTVYPFAEEAAIVCNDEAKLEGMRLNRALYDAEGEIYDIVAGPFIVVGLGEEDFTSLPPELIDKIQKQFKQPEMFIKVNGEVQAVPVKPSIKAKLDQLQKEKRSDKCPQKEPPKHEL